MIIVIFGLFNIITAVFVESTISGLKHNDLKKKYAHTFVKHRLRRLVSRLHRVSCVEDSAAGMTTSFDQDEFRLILQDEEIKELLHELDIEVFDQRGLFDILDANGSGQITLPQFINGVLNVRGDPRKNDVIACWSSILSLHQKLDQFLGDLTPRLLEQKHGLRAP